MDNDITINRKIQKWGWYKDANTMRVFIHLLLNANWHDGDYLGQKILRGQCIFGRKRFAEELGASERMIRTAITHLKTTNEITIRTTNKFSVITIVNYSVYQSSKKQNDQQNDQQEVQRATNERPTSDHIQEVKKERSKEVKNIYGEFSNVKLTIEEYQKLLNLLGTQTQSYIDRLDGYITSKGAKYKSHYATILNWYRKDEKDKPQSKSGNPFLDMLKEEQCEQD